MKVEYVYDASRDWYIRCETYVANGKKFIRKMAVEYYVGKTNIPRVPRKKSRKVRFSS